MSRLNIIMDLVANPKYKDTFRAIRLPDPYTVVAVTTCNNLIIVSYTHEDSSSTRSAIPKEKVVQIVAGFSEIT